MHFSALNLYILDIRITVHVVDEFGGNSHKVIKLFGLVFSAPVMFGKLLEHDNNNMSHDQQQLTEFILYSASTVLCETET